MRNLRHSSKINEVIKNGLQEKLFAQVVDMPGEKGFILKKGTIVDSTIISAPSSTKNADKKRDPNEQNAAFVAAMEDVLAVYGRPYDEKYHVVCMDEKTCTVLCGFKKIQEVKEWNYI